MKLSSLNKFKGKFISLLEKSPEYDYEPVIQIGKVEDIEEDNITIEEKDGSLIRILIKHIFEICEIDEKDIQNTGPVTIKGVKNKPK